MANEGTVKKVYIDRPKEEVLLQAAEGLKPKVLSGALKSHELTGKAFKGGKFLSGFAIKALLNNVTLFLGYAWMPFSLFLSMMGSASTAHIKLAEVEGRINELKSVLNEYIQYARELCSVAETARELASYSLTGMEVTDAERQAFREAAEHLTNINYELNSMRELGERMDEALASLPETERMLRGQGRGHSVKMAKEIEHMMIDYGEVVRFKKSLSRVREMIRKLE